MAEPLIMKPESKYYPTMIIGVCRKCGLVGNLDVPVGNYEIGDRLMNRQVVPGDCPKCQQTTEFYPIKNVDQNDPRAAFLIREEVRRLREAGLVA